MLKFSLLHSFLSCITIYSFRYAHLQKLSDERAKKLEDSMKLQQFLRDVEEVRIYILHFNAKGVVDAHVEQKCSVIVLQKHSCTH